MRGPTGQLAQELELGNGRCLTSSVVLYLVEPKTSFVSKFPYLLNLALIHFGLACLFLCSMCTGARFEFNPQRTTEFSIQQLVNQPGN